MVGAGAFVDLVGPDPLIQAAVAGVIVSAMNLVGASLILVVRSPSERFLDSALGFAAGVMVAAAFTSLILPGVEYANGNPLPVLGGVLLGTVVLDRADALVPHAHYLLNGRRRQETERSGGSTIDESRLGALVLFVLAITLHNMPEGLAVGVGFGSAASGAGTIGDALALMIAIGLQNIPEGLAVSVAAVNAGLDKRSYAIFAGFRAGVVELPLVVLGAYAVTIVAPLLPWVMGFAAGAMLFVVLDEVVPETHARGNERLASLGAMLGVVVMVYLDVALA